LKEKEQEKGKVNIQDTQRKIQEVEKIILSIDAKISGSDPEKLQKIKTEKNELLVQQERIEHSLPKQEFLDFYLKYEKDLDTSLPKEIGDIHITTLSLFVQGIITFGKNINEKVQNIDLQVKNEELRSSQQKTTREQDIKNTSEKIQDLEKQKENLEKKIQLFDQETEQQAAFDCSKIGTNCPFIKVINKQHFEKLEEQKKRFLEEKVILEKNIQTTQASKTQKEVQLQELLTVSTTNQTIATHKAEQERLQSLITEIKSFLNEVNYSKLQEEFTSYQTQETKIKTLDKDISLLEEMLRQMEALRGEKEKCNIQITSMKETIAQILKDQEVQEKEITILNEQIQSLDPARLQKVESLTTSIKETSRDLQVLINEFKDIQIEVKALQEEEKMLGELYNIFAKELLLLVLQDSLPVLNDIINNYLTQVVDYQIKFTLEKTGSDKLELAASIIDERGEREIKSLSGGQMVVLKLVWMLSISSYLHSPMLFLDETINNLDGETVGKVAELLENFVHQRAMKLYTVTNSQHIQDMDIRDATIDISTVA
jgi:DNA repair exonuclease SbcCD ATPase subunit